MGRRSSRLRFWKWVGTVVCTLLILAIVVSHDRLAGGCAVGSRDVRFELMRGAGTLWWLSGYARGQGFDAAQLARHGVYWFWDGSWWPQAYSEPVFGYIIVPLWLPLIIVAIPTTIFWFRDRRRIRPGYCRACAYDLTGNVSGRCPECGTPAARAAT